TIMGVYFVDLQREMNASILIGIFSGLLACANCVLARAIAVPSTGARTVWVSTASMAPILPATAIGVGDAGSVINIACWMAVTVGIATVGSRLIFGLRREDDRLAT